MTEAEVKQAKKDAWKKHWEEIHRIWELCPHKWDRERDPVYCSICHASEIAITGEDNF